MKNFLILLLTCSVSMYAAGQAKNGHVTGTVTDGDTRTVELATITLKNAADSSVAKMGVADKTGHYSFEGLAEGRYFVSISAVGHEPGTSMVFSISAANPSVEVPSIELVPVAKAVSGVTVTARKPLIEQKIDRTVVNVDASITNVGNSALEVLEKAPGITVDKDGNISLKGKQGVQIYIDGRPSYLSGADLANLLRSMTASQLEQLEIMTNPPAKYDAAGNAGVINIKLKKNKQFGYNGSITAGFTQGRYPRTDDNASFNYRNQKLNVFSNLSLTRNQRGQELYITRNFRDNNDNILSMFDQTTRMKNRRGYYSANAGLDYTVSNKTTVGVVLSTFYNPGTWSAATGSSIYEPDGSLNGTTDALSKTHQTWKNFSGNLNFRTVFDSAGQELSGNIDYISYDASNSQSLTSHYFDKFGAPSEVPDTLLGNLPQNIKIYSGKLDYTLPLQHDASFEAGIKSSYVETDNNAIYDNMEMGSAVLDSARSNHFIYHENINAAYVNYRRPLGKKWNTQLGLRAENTNANGRSIGYEYNSGTNEFEASTKTFSRNYTQLFPTAYLQYKASDKHSFVLNYGRRINRPDYEDLNPFIEFLDRYTFRQGNPNLKPQFAHNIELSHTYKSILTTTVNYTSTVDIIQDVLQQNTATSETFISKSNIASSHQWGLSVNAGFDLAKGWSMNLYGIAYNNHFRGMVNNVPIELSLTGAMFQGQTQIKWGKGWGAELSGFYRTRALEGVIFIEPMGQVSAGFSKQILKKKGSLRLNVRDIFAGSVFTGSSRYGDVDARFRNVNDSRAVTLTFSWRFAKGKQMQNGQRKRGGADDEQNRVRSGN